MTPVGPATEAGAPVVPSAPKAAAERLEYLVRLVLESGNGVSPADWWLRSLRERMAQAAQAWELEVAEARARMPKEREAEIRRAIVRFVPPWSTVADDLLAELDAERADSAQAAQAVVDAQRGEHEAIARAEAAEARLAAVREEAFHYCSRAREERDKALTMLAELRAQGVEVLGVEAGRGRTARLFEVEERVSPVQTVAGVMYEARVRLVVYERGPGGLLNPTWEGTWIGSRCTSDRHARREFPRGVSECYREAFGKVNAT